MSLTKKSSFSYPEFSAHEHVSDLHDAPTGLRAIIAIHSEPTNRPEAETHRMVEGIYDTCVKVFDLADERACTPLEAADRLAEEKLGERRLM